MFGRYTIDAILDFENARSNDYTDLEWAIKTATPNIIKKYTDPTLLNHGKWFRHLLTLIKMPFEKRPITNSR